MSRQSALSPRQSEVLRLASEEGLTKKEIAARLGISENTVAKHRHKLLRKLGARSMPHAVWLALR